MALLQGPSAKQAEVIKQELGESGDDLERGVRDLMNMCAALPHLPQPKMLHRNILELFVRGCRLDTERAREKFEAFCLARARHGDLYEYRSLNEPPLNEFCKFMDVIPLPKLTDEGLRVTVLRIRPDYPENSDDIVNAVRAILLISDCRMHDEKLIAGDVFVYEISAVRASLAARIAAALGAVRRGVHLAHAAYPQRLKRIHIVGAQPFIASSIQLLRSCLSEKIKKRFLLHSKMEDLLDHIPARVLPVEWGGTEDPIDTLTKRWRRRVDELREYLRELNEYSNSTTEHISNKDIYGTMGAFRKLDID